MSNVPDILYYIYSISTGSLCSVSPKSLTQQFFCGRTKAASGRALCKCLHGEVATSQNYNQGVSGFFCLLERLKSLWRGLKNDLILWVNLCVTFESVCVCRFEGIKVTCCISWMPVALVMLTGFASFIKPLHRSRRTWPPFRYDKMPQADNHRLSLKDTLLLCALFEFGKLYTDNQFVHQSMPV